MLTGCVLDEERSDEFAEYERLEVLEEPGDDEREPDGYQGDVSWNASWNDTLDTDDEDFPLQVASTGNQNLRIVSLNMGPGDPTSDYSTLKGHLQASDRIVVLQEVQNLSGMRSELSADYPYEYVTENYGDEYFEWSCLCSRRKRNNVVILSKLPIVHRESTLVQQDPGGDKWRRHGQYVKIKYANDSNLRLFHYHNTYNWHNNSSEYEKSGMQAFRDWVETKVGTLSSSTDRVFMAGDFNLSFSSLEPILGSSLIYESDWVDYIVSTNRTKASGGSIDASAISDHDLVWAEWNLTSNIHSAQHYVVRLYEHTNFSGGMATFERGNYGWIEDEYPGWNDKVSSIRVGGYVKLHAWEHAWYGGTKWCLPTESGCGISNYNDKFSSLKVLSR